LKKRRNQHVAARFVAATYGVDVEKAGNSKVKFMRLANGWKIFLSQFELTLLALFIGHQLRTSDRKAAARAEPKSSVFG
jgi:hypothetical protein